MLTNWVWGPRQNKEATKTIIKPINRVIFDKLFKSKMVKSLMSELKEEIRNVLKPNWIAKKLEYYINKVVKDVSDETTFEAEYAYDQQVINDFSFNVGRKLHVVNVVLKVGK